MAQPIDLEKAIKSIQDNIKVNGYYKRSAIDQYLELYRTFIEMEHKIDKLASETEGETEESVLNTLYELIVLCDMLKISFHEEFIHKKIYREPFIFSDYEFIVNLGIKIQDYLNGQGDEEGIEHDLTICLIWIKLTIKNYLGGLTNGSTDKKGS